MSYSAQETVAVVEAYVHSASFKETQKIFVDKFPNVSIPAKSSLPESFKKCGLQDLWKIHNGLGYFLRIPKAVANIQQRIPASLKNLFKSYHNKVASQQNC